MVISHSYVSLPEGKSPFSYGFPMVFLWLTYQYPLPIWDGRPSRSQVLKMPSDCSDGSGDPSHPSRVFEGWRHFSGISGWVSITRFPSPETHGFFHGFYGKSWGYLGYFRGRSCLRWPRSQAAAQAPKLWIFGGKNREIWRSKISNSTEVRIWNDLYSSIAQWLDCFVPINFGGFL